MATKTWRQDMTYGSVLFRMIECKDKESFDLVRVNTTLDGQFVSSILYEMKDEGLVRLNDTRTYWEPTTKGKEVYKRLIGMSDLASQFLIFSCVDVATPLDPQIADPEDQFQVLPYEWDPRFPRIDQDATFPPGVKDMRIAFFDFMSDHLNSDPTARKTMQGKRIDPRIAIFEQMLPGLRSTEWQFWSKLRLGGYFNEVEEIASVAYRWKDMYPDDLQIAKKCMLSLYKAGMNEVIKRRAKNGTCSACGAALGLYMVNGDPDTCPKCQASFKVPEPIQAPGVVETCPNCGTILTPDQTRCTCGARIDRGGQEGTVRRRLVEDDATTTIVTTGWTTTYGYSPIEYLYPDDPLADVAVIAILAGSLCW